ncbi:Baseplate protein J-like [uncultured Caudovirales phage]|uniref:Baseplate protein J-like n=1 Tax=uncultured Caudovirales phage TaxID=2100421 RepID=A0A6J5LZ79_9CAUD|nr:Baseplate protein J-like [uncultured Caudovirales phage]
MAFQIKDFVSIAAAMLNWMRGSQTNLTDFSVGSVSRTLVEAPAVEIDELYQQMFNGIREAIPTAIYHAFNFDLLPPAAATGLVRVTITSSVTDTVIPAGTTFARPDSPVSYSSAVDVTIAAGNTTGDVLVLAGEAGPAGNAPAGLSWTMTPSPATFVSASNIAGFYSGTAAETEDGRKTRFAAYVQSLARGTVAALEYGAATAALYDVAGNITERVMWAKVVEPYLSDPLQPVGWVQLYVHNGVGSTSAGLVTRAAEVIHGYYDAKGNPVPGWKAAGVQVDVAAATQTAVPVTGAIYAETGYAAASLVAPVQAAIAAYLTELPIGGPAYRAEIIAAAMGVPGVRNFTLAAPATDNIPAATVKLWPGTFTLTTP